MTIDDLRNTLAATGSLRAAINLGNPVLAQLSKDGTPSGVSVTLASATAERLGVPLTTTCVGHAKDSFSAIVEGKVDIAFLAVDLERAQSVAFSRPYLQIEGTYLLNRESDARTVSDLDRAGAKIASSNGSAYGLHLARTLQQATLVETGELEQAVKALAAGEVDAVAGIRQSLDAVAKTGDRFRVLSDHFLEIHQAVGVSKAHESVLHLIDEIIQKTTASGALADALQASGQNATLLA